MAHQLLLQASLQRLVNRGGMAEREGEGQTRESMARMGAVEGHLFLLDARDPKQPFAEPIEHLDLGQGLTRWLF